MHLIGRWERIRGYSTTSGWGPAQLLDRKWSELRPIKGEWWQTRSGFWLPVAFLEERGALTLRGPDEFGGISLGIGSEDTSNTFSQTTLNNNYTYGSAGNCWAARYVPGVTRTLNTVYLNIDLFTGTAANTDDIDVEVRDSSSKPGSTLHASVTYNPSSTTGWKAVTGFTQSLTAGTIYWIAVGDPDGAAGTNARYLNRWGYNTGAFEREADFGMNLAVCTSTNGFSTASIGSTIPLIVLVFADGHIVGFPFSAAATTTSTTGQKGVLLNGGFAGKVKLWGAKVAAQSSVYSGLEVWSGSNGPGGSADIATTTLALLTLRQIGDTSKVGFRFATPVQLSASTNYRIVFSYGSSGTMTRLGIGTGADSTLKAAMLGGGNIYSTLNSAGSWSDENDKLPAITLFFDDFTSSGGSPLVGGGLAR